MAKSTRNKARQKIEQYLAQKPDATLKQIGEILGVSKQEAHTILRLLGMEPKRHRLRRTNANNSLLTEREIGILYYVASGKTNK